MSPQGYTALSLVFAFKAANPARNFALALRSRAPQMLKAVAAHGVVPRSVKRCASSVGHKAEFVTSGWVSREGKLVNCSVQVVERFLCSSNFIGEVHAFTLAPTGKDDFQVGVGAGRAANQAVRRGRLSLAGL
jgi:hypothetical protein